MKQWEQDSELLNRICLGNAEAIDFLSRWWAPYVHGIDDIVDGDTTDAEEILKVFVGALHFYTHPFFLRNASALRQVVLLVTNAYADSVAWERSKVEWQRDWADHNRHAGMEMVIAVAQIVGGYEHGRAISLEQRVICYVGHHDRQGNAK